MIRVTADAPNAPPILALDPVAVAAEIGSTEPEAEALIGQVTALAERLAGGKIWFRTYLDILPGLCGERMYLNHGRPVAVLGSVKVGVDGDPLVEGDAEDFILFADAGYLYRKGGWTASALWYVAYSGGWWTPSMGDAAAATAASATRLADGAPDAEGAIFDVVRASYTERQREPGLKREEGVDTEFEYFASGQIAAPSRSAAILRNLGPPNVI